MDTGSEVSTLTINDQVNLFPYLNIEKTNISFKNFDESLSIQIGMIKKYKCLLEQFKKTSRCLYY